MLKCNLGVIQAQRKRDKIRPYTTGDLAVATGFSRNTIANLINGNTNRFDGAILDKLCGVLDIGIEELLLYTPEAKE